MEGEDANRRTVALVKPREALSRLAPRIEALGYAITGDVPSDLGVASVALVEVEGVEAVAALSEAHPELPLIGTSTEPTVALVVASMRAGAFDFVEPDSPANALGRTLQRACAHGRLLRENRDLRRNLKRGETRLPLEEHGSLMRAVLEQVQRVADREGPVLITGESGTGKDVVARLIHDLSPRREGPWLPVSCGSLVRDLIDTELFGHEVGAFTDARERRLGLIEVAAPGTILLDEVANVPLEAQSRLLRFLETGEFRRVGGSVLRSASVRILASTSRDLEREGTAGRFRPDLFYRLSAFTIALPPLRERRDEIPALVRLFAGPRAVDALPLSPDALRVLTEHDWPGNLRELKNVIEGALRRTQGGPLRAEDLHCLLSRSSTKSDLTLETFQRRHVERVLVAHGWNRTQAARALGVSVRTLYSRIKEYGLEEPS